MRPQGRQPAARFALEGAVFRTLPELAALSGLTPDQREILVDRVLLRRPHQDIARSMGLEHANVRKLHQRAGERYQAALEREPITAEIMAEPCGGALARAL
jgi:DNA-directed RNA polymerase specialized sigma24 family protein